jgi:hypothetical protein
VLSSHALTQQEKDRVQTWAVGFNAYRPPDGRLTAEVISSVGPIPTEGEAAHQVAREYFASKLPAAMERRKYALAAPDSSTMSEDWFNAPDYWNAVIAWLDALTSKGQAADDQDQPGGGNRAMAPPLPDRPRWYFRDDAVELDRDFTIDGKPYRKGVTGKVLELQDDTLARLARQGRVAVMLPGNDLIVVPVTLLLPAGEGAAQPTGGDGCTHPSWAQVRFRWGAVNQDRRARPFWQASGCSRCGLITDQESDEYYGEDMHLVHLKWRGSTW